MFPPGNNASFVKMSTGMLGLGVYEGRVDNISTLPGDVGGGVVSIAVLAVLITLKLDAIRKKRFTAISIITEHIPFEYK